ncbi:unnamed protein product [Rotaria sp. Silwood2]|nr:unnamed protein product [Rotaria sp. Silwood2]CAF3088558.1 unnamed protein product [Rotaria sp. Silwood2]CAF3362241.1 unnamed protein product [Rotaria sp. Silwood2]CAF4039658.1 unnamed protein product [Rotaria sp. Silwood2]CAF4123250.1 unnamed protein product [Rotaria sp. Silwood2]
MASSVSKQPCKKCCKSGGIATCGGCEQWFCGKHFNEHRQELALEIDNIEQEHNLLQRDLFEENATNSLLSQIDDWEHKSIKKIQAAAEKARMDLRKYLDHSKQQLKTSLYELAKELQSGRESDDYTEMDLKKWMGQLKELREMLQNPSTIDIIDDNQANSNIRLIGVKQYQTTNKAGRLPKKASFVTRSSGWSLLRNS